MIYRVDNGSISDLYIRVISDLDVGFKKNPTYQTSDPIHHCDITLILDSNIIYWIPIMPRHHTYLPSQYRPDGKTKYVKINIDPISFINIGAREPAVIGSLTILLTPLPPPTKSTGSVGNILRCWVLGRGSGANWGGQVGQLPRLNGILPRLNFLCPLIKWGKVI